MAARVRPISGFPEFLPNGRIVEQRALAALHHTFELHGFGEIETRAVEPLSVLLRKGEIDKEVYAVRRLHAEPGRESSEEDLALHFDLTVPFARYILENAGHLAFPFRRWQAQKVWRGERPQDGRYREFRQADIDIVGQDSLAAHHEAEIALVALEAYARLEAELGLPAVVLHVNNRKLSQGFYEGLGIEDTAAVLQRVDKYDKIGPTKVAELLVTELGLSQSVADQCVALAGIQASDSGFIDAVRALGVTSELLDAGLAELSTLVDTVTTQGLSGRILADLKIARGLDYYTGTVYETELLGHSKLGSVGSGGRYDQLASDGKRTFPGVGFSFGISRLLVPLINRDEIRASRDVPTCVLVAVTSDEARADSLATARELRARGISAEVAPSADKFGKQIKYADRRGIPFVWFPQGANSGEVKDLRSGDQVQASATTWTPPAEDLRPSIIGPGQTS